MIPRHVRAVIALGALALVQSTLAIDFVQSDINPMQCGAGESCSVIQAAAAHKSAPSERVQGASGEMMAVKQQQLFEWLSASQAPVDKAAFSVQLTQQDLVDIGETPDANGVILRPDPRKVQVGVDKEFLFDVRFDSLRDKRLTGAQPHMGGTVAEGLSGELVWTAQAYSKGASALRIGIEEFDLPASAELYVYSASGQAFGPYTGRGPTSEGYFWSNTIMGDTVTLQFHYYGPRDAASLKNLGFSIASITHIGSRFPLADFVGGNETGEKAHCSYNASCVEPASASGGAPVGGAKDAVALMIYNSQGGAFICSGGLLADTDNASVIPYFLTANHCISKGREANSLETFFDFDTDCADRYAQNGSYPGTNGSSIKSTNRTSDYTLLQLDQTPGGNRVYLGWNNSPVAFNNGADLYRISHPAGAPQAYSHHTVDTGKGTCSVWPRGDWIYSNDEFGATEGGSSGSPVLNAAGEVVGQLSGACGTDVNNTCNTVDNATVDGALAAYYSAVAPFLDPSGGPGGGCDLGQPGDACSSDSECCSNKCKGPPGGKTCR